MPSRPDKVIVGGVRELWSLTSRFAGKVKDKYIWTKQEVEEARGYLIYFRDTMRSEDPKLFHEVFGESGDFFELEPFARGYTARILSFKTIVGSKVKKWVIKVGFQVALIEDNGDPSKAGYSQEYQGYLDTLRKAVAKYPHLKHLLPEPQVVTWATLALEGEEKKGTTLAIQPCMQVVKPRDLRKVLTKDEKKQLLTELREFQTLSEYLIKNHQVRPELVGEGNLEIVRRGRQYHLMLLDMGWVDLKKDLPITHTVAHFSAAMVISKLENWLRNRVRD